MPLTPPETPNPKLKHPMCDKLIRRRLISSPGPDHTSYLPDECLAIIFNSLPYGGRDRCSLVCRRWLRIEGQNRHRLTLDVRSQWSVLLPSIPPMFARFDSVTELSLSSYRGLIIPDEALTLISLNCNNLTHLSLRSCQFSADGIDAFLKNCARLKMLLCKYCTAFSAERIRITEPIGLGASLEVICLEMIDNVQILLVPLMAASKSLRTLKLLGPSRKLAIGDDDLDWKAKQIGNESVMAVAENCRSLEELELNGGVDVAELSLEKLAANCAKLEKLSIVKNETVGDAELRCIVGKCNALKRLWIENCPSVTDGGTRALAYGCPNLAEATVRGCKKVTLKGVEWLRATRPSLSFKLI